MASGLNQATQELRERWGPPCYRLYRLKPGIPVMCIRPGSSSRGFAICLILSPLTCFEGPRNGESRVSSRRLSITARQVKSG
jgi:hypothetical protein